jgi:hypothetical protein
MTAVVFSIGLALCASSIAVQEMMSKADAIKVFMLGFFFLILASFMADMVGLL